MNNKLFFAIGLAATLLQAPVTVSAQSSGTSQQNPLLMKSNLPFGAPDFSRIKESDYLPAIEAAIKIKRDNIQKIVDNKKKPTFQNTILAYEESGVMLDRVINVFDGLTSAHKTPVIAETEDKVMPLLTSEEMTPFKLSSNDLRDTNLMQIFVFGSADQVLLCARLDNLGKGASGAAVQCLNIMMGIDETTGLL